LQAVGARHERVGTRVSLSTQKGVWELDIQALIGACDERTRATFVGSAGSAGNPTGWMIERDRRRRSLTALAL